MPDNTVTETRLNLVRVEFAWRRQGVSADELATVLRILAPQRPDTVALRDDASMHLAERWMIAWGWSITPAYVGETFNASRLHDRVGVWGDFLLWEDEKVLWPGLAPLVQAGSAIIYEPDIRYHDTEDPILKSARHERVGWRFDGSTARLVPVEQTIIYEPTNDTIWPTT